MWTKYLIYLFTIISLTFGFPDNQIDHLDDNVGQLLEAYIQNKTTPSSFGNILEKVRESGFGSALKFILGFDITKEQLCTICPIGFNFVALERRQGMTNIQLTGEIAYFCSTLGIETEEVCLGLIEPVVDVFAYMIDTNNNLTGKLICDLLLDNLNCNGSVREEWHVDLPEGSTVAPPKEVGKKPFKVLQISDVHYDPLYTEGKSLDCKAPTCCQPEQDNAKNGDDYCSKWSNYLNADTPKRTLDAVFEKASTYDFDFVYLTGDIVSHRCWSTSPQHNKAVITEVLDLAKKTFKKPIYFVLGNHEGHPVDAFAPDNVGDLNSAWLYEIMFDYLPVEQTDEIKKTLLKGGYYTTSPTKGLRLIVLNDNVCENKNWWNIADTKDPLGQLQWMAQVLEQAEKDQEWVHILAHIPTGHCLTIWSREFNRIINRFANTIVGQFYGHTHQDEFYVFYNKSDITQAINIGWNGGSIMPDRSNPSFKIYEVDDVTFRVLDAEEYYFNLTDANAYASESSKLSWQQLYAFKKDFGLKSLELSELDNLVNRMAQDHSLLSKYYEFKHRKSDYALQHPCDDNCLVALLCSIVNTEFGETGKCESLKKMFLQAK